MSAEQTSTRPGIPVMIVNVEDLRILGGLVFRAVQREFPIGAPHFFICWEKVVTLVRELPYIVTFDKERLMLFHELFSLLIESEFLDQAIFDRIKFHTILAEQFPFRPGIYDPTRSAEGSA